MCCPVGINRARVLCGDGYSILLRAALELCVFQNFLPRWLAYIYWPVCPPHNNNMSWLGLCHSKRCNQIWKRAIPLCLLVISIWEYLHSDCIDNKELIILFPLRILWVKWIGTVDWLLLGTHWNLHIPIEAFGTSLHWEWRPCSHFENRDLCRRQRNINWKLIPQSTLSFEKWVDYKPLVYGLCEH